MSASYNDGQGGMVMEDVVLGMTGTSAVKIIMLIDKEKGVPTSEPLTLIQDRAGYSEQDPKNGLKWLRKVLNILMKCL